MNLQFSFRKEAKCHTKRYMVCFLRGTSPWQTIECSPVRARRRVIGICDWLSFYLIMQVCMSQCRWKLKAFSLEFSWICFLQTVTYNATGVIGLWMHPGVKSVWEESRNTLDTVLIREQPIGILCKLWFKIHDAISSSMHITHESIPHSIQLLIVRQACRRPLYWKERPDDAAGINNGTSLRNRHLSRSIPSRYIIPSKYNEVGNVSGLRDASIPYAKSYQPHNSLSTKHASSKPRGQSSNRAPVNAYTNGVFHL